MVRVLLLVVGCLLPSVALGLVSCAELIRTDLLPATEFELRSILADPDNFPMKLFLSDVPNQSLHISCYTLEKSLEIVYYNEKTEAYETTGPPFKIEYDRGTLWLTYFFGDDVFGTGGGTKETRMHIAAMQDEFMLIEICSNNYILFTYDQYGLFTMKPSLTRTGDINCISDAIYEDYGIANMIPNGMCTDR